MPRFLFRNIQTSALTELTGAMPFDVGALLPAGSYEVHAVSEAAPAALIVGGTAQAPGQVAGLTLVPGDGRIDLGWTAPHHGGAPITGYAVEADSGGGFVRLPGGAGAQTGYGHAGLANGTSYRYRVAAINAVGTGAFSAEVSGVPGVAPAPAVAEAGAEGHWLLGADNAADSDLLTARALVRNGAAPARGAGFLTVSGRGNGLLTGIRDNADITFCAVVRRRSGAAQAMLGGVMPGPSLNEGWSPFTVEPDILAMRTKGGTERIDIDTNFPRDAFCFIAMSLSAQGAHVYFRGGDTGNLVASGITGRGGVRALDVALGDVHFDADTFAGAADFAELIVFHSAKTQADLAAIFLRSRDRMAARGITLVAPVG